MPQLLKRLTGLNLILAMSFSTMASALDLSEVKNLHPVRVRDNRTGKMVDGQAGLKVEPLTGREVKYRFFTDPLNGDEVEQYLMGIGADGKETIRTVRYPKTPLTADGSDAESSLSGPAIASIAVGAVAMGLVGSIAYKAHKSKRRCVETLRKAHGRSPTRAEMPSHVTLDRSVPREGGRRVRVAGALPAGSAPTNTKRYQTSDGDTYMLQPNPATGFLEPWLLYHHLFEPYYFDGADSPAAVREREFFESEDHRSELYSDTIPELRHSPFPMERNDTPVERPHTPEPTRYEEPARYDPPTPAYEPPATYDPPAPTYDPPPDFGSGGGGTDW